MSSEMSIRAERLSKTYPIFASPRDRLRQMLRPGRSGVREHAALRDVTFEIATGETVGVIGQNGSGKSTLLQVVAGTLTPTSGTCEVRGRVAALLELGAGFNLDFSGRENVYLAGAILGLSSEEMRERYEAIVAFAEIGDLVDQPVKTYSTGMYLRLAFAVAVSVAPDVLLIDEILSVGDVRFQLKCIERMRELQRAGTTIVFVSHSIETVRRLCGRCLWLDGGRLMLDGEASSVADRYVAHMSSLEGNEASAAGANGTSAHTASANGASGNGASGIGASGNGAAPASFEEAAQPPTFAEPGALARILEVSVSSERPRFREPLRVRVELEVREDRIPEFLVGVAIYATQRTYLFGTNTALDGVAVPATRGRHRIDYVVPRLPLLGGGYTLDVGLFADHGLVCLDYRTDAARFHVEAPYVAEGLVHIEHAWETSG